MFSNKFPFTLISRFAILAFCSIAFTSVTNATTPSTLFSFTSEPGDYIGQGQTKSYAPPSAKFTVSGSADSLSISVSDESTFWYISLAPEYQQKLRVGTFYNTERAPFRTGRAPGLDVSGEGRGCNTLWGNFSINQIEFNSDGTLKLLDASFTERCESSTAPALTGKIKYNVLPLSFSFKSDLGDYIGGGLLRSYANATSVFNLSGTLASVWFSVSGNRDNWNASIAAPTGKTFIPGTYHISRFGDATHARFDFYGDGRGCNQTSGYLTINSISTDTSGNVVGLNATFVQYCDNSSGALRGTIKYKE